MHSPAQNHLLAAMTPGAFGRWASHLEYVEMPLGDVLYESGGRPEHVYFPTTSIVSLIYVLIDGASAEIAVVGNEGLLGISLFMGGETTPSRAIVQSAGFGYCLKAQLVCNRHHSVDQQLCRWLLLSLDRLSSNNLVMTQELIVNMLGVRREGVTEAAGKLQRAGIIRYTRGRIEVTDRKRLEETVCK